MAHYSYNYISPHPPLIQSGLFLPFSSFPICIPIPFPLYFFPLWRQQLLCLPLSTMHIRIPFMYCCCLHYCLHLVVIYKYKAWMFEPSFLMVSSDSAPSLLRPCIWSVPTPLLLFSLSVYFFLFLGSKPLYFCKIWLFLPFFVQPGLPFLICLIHFFYIGLRLPTVS